jgi:catechol 2,3-dioxygenase-like lactoylglutathione lyase family enzyme
MSDAMKSVAQVLIACLLSIPAFCQAHPAQRPHITGIDHVAFYTTDPDGAKKLYSDILGLASAEPLEAGETVRYMAGVQWVGYSPAPDPKATDRMDHTAFTTDNIIALRRYLTEKGIKASQIQGRSDHSLSFMTQDPEGHHIEFVERAKGETAPAAPNAVSRRLIHVGFLVYKPDAEDHFYREILGFRPYWHGGMKDNVTDWVSLQVPDGTDWLEYMLNQPEHPDLRLTGVMNHISLGVADMSKAKALIEAHGWKEHGDEHAQMGRDGKRQLNVFDPDRTRIELMEFKPAEKPCCSDFTGPHPTE